MEFEGFGCGYSQLHSPYSTIHIYLMFVPRLYLLSSSSPSPLPPSPSAIQNLQDNVGRLESRVMVLEKEGGFKSSYPIKSVPSLSDPVEVHESSDSDAPGGSLGPATNGVGDKSEAEYSTSCQTLPKPQQRSSSGSSSSSRQDSSYLLPTFEQNGVSSPKDLSFERTNSGPSPSTGGDGNAEDSRGDPLFVKLFENQECNPGVSYCHINI